MKEGLYSLFRVIGYSLNRGGAEVEMLFGYRGKKINLLL